MTSARLPGTDTTPAAKEIWETYTSAWRAKTPEEKRAALRESVLPSAVYRDPLAECAGHDALVAYMLQFHRQLPGGHFETTYFLAHHGRSIAKWKMLDEAGNQLGDGVSYAEYGADGKLASMSGFFDAPTVS